MCLNDKEMEKKWKTFLSKKENRERFLIMILLGVLFLVVCLPVKSDSNVVEKRKEEDKKTEETTLLSAKNTTGDEGLQEAIDMTETENYAIFLEDRLERLLAGVDGAGQIKVMVTLKSSEEEIVEKDRPANRVNVTENDAAGGSRSSSEMDSEESTVYIIDENGKQIPYVRKTVQPSVEGVVVIASGGDNGAVKKNITEAIQALFGIEAHKIKIIKMKSSGK